NAFQRRRMIGDRLPKIVDPVDAPRRFNIRINGCDLRRGFIFLDERGCIISSILAPSDWLSRVSTRSCLVTRSALGSTVFNGDLALAAADVTLRRDVAFDLALPFLNAALLGFRDFARERVDMGLGSVGSRRRN
ncbi:MAG TPA: hypothetical protein VN890_00170, partial [Methylocella sp.]|nr:hypothetical protein [Methylocella sp.]